MLVSSSILLGSDLELDINKVGRGEYSFLELMLMTFLVQVLGLNLAYVLLRRTVILVGMLFCGRNQNTLANPFCGKQVAPGEACTKTVAEKEASRVDFHSHGLLSYNYIIMLLSTTTVYHGNATNIANDRPW